MGRGAAGESDGTPGVPVPVPIAQRLRGFVPALQTLQLLLREVSYDDYENGLHSRDPVVLKETVLPLERAFEIVDNFIVELTGLALKELGIASTDGIRELEALAGEGLITKRLAEQLADIHRARNSLTHDYPDVRASIVYPACQEAAKLVLPFSRSYMRWLGEIGYAVPNV